MRRRSRSGPVFRAVDGYGKAAEDRLLADSIGGIVNAPARPPATTGSNLPGTALCAGLATQAAANGVSERVIMKQTQHRSLNTLRRYIREGSLFRENAASQVGL